MKRLGILLGAGTVLALAVGGLLWSLRPEPGPPSDAAVAIWEAAPTEVEHLGGHPHNGCTFAERIEIEKQHRVGPGAGDGVRATCKYVMHLEGWPAGEKECILEFPIDGITAVRPTTLGARLAATYYRHRQGGLMYFRGATPGRAFVSLDARWCRWASVPEGLRAIP